MITIGKAIYSILSSDAQLSGMIKGIYPLVAPENVEAPFIVYEREGEGLYSNDGVCGYDVNFTITVISTDYKTGLDIASRINQILNGYRGTVSDIVIARIVLQSVSEEYNDGEFLQKVNYLITTKN